MHWQRNIEVLTPLFNRGAYQDTPEIRVPSIRGMVRWWFRALGSTADDEKGIFGGMKKFGQRLTKDVLASSLVFRVSNVLVEKAVATPTLPHKQSGQASPQLAFPPGTTFRLDVFSRFGDSNSASWTKVERALGVWLLLGSLGLRGNRSGGNVWPADGKEPKSPVELLAQLDQFGFRWPIMIAGSEVGTSVHQLRAAATDTVNGLEWVFGYAHGRERCASPLKFKIVRFGHDLRLLIFAPEQRILDEARRALKGHRSKPETWTALRS